MNQNQKLIAQIEAIIMLIINLLKFNFRMLVIHRAKNNTGDCSYCSDVITEYYTVAFCVI